MSRRSSLDPTSLDHLEVVAKLLGLSGIVPVEELLHAAGALEPPPRAPPTPPPHLPAAATDPLPGAARRAAHPAREVERRCDRRRRVPSRGTWSASHRRS